ncbi:MAG: HAMP domain-containing sensor histidine kinase, partial [Pseudomonadota bacterium]
EDLREVLPDGVPNSVQEKLDMLRGRVTRMNRMLSDMLTFARSTHGQVLVQEKTIDINGILSDAKTWIDKPDGMHLNIDTIDFGLKVAPTGLRQVLQNLLTNAVRHHDRQEGKVDVTGQQNADGSATIVVTDDGPGIAPEYHESVFKAFTTLKRRDEVDSTGVGLAVVDRLMTNLGGRVAVVSPVDDRGCRFELTFPADLVGALV